MSNFTPILPYQVFPDKKSTSVLQDKFKSLTCTGDPYTWPVDHDREHHDGRLMRIAWEVVNNIQDL
jgi:hypothetical protein